MRIRFPFLISIPFILFFLHACVPAAIGGAAGAGTALYRDKTVGESFSDQTIWTKIRAAFVNEDIDSPVGDINVKVSEGRVLLTGTIQNRDLMVKAIRLCWKQDGVKEVINELKLPGKVNGGLKQYALDSWITTRLKSQLFFNGDVKSVNYNIITIDGIVYVIGIAQSQKELDTVTNTASQISGVREVISYVRVKQNSEDISSDSGSTSIDEFADKEVSVEDFDSDETKTKTTPRHENKNTGSKSVSKKQDEDIFSDEDL